MKQRRNPFVAISLALASATSLHATTFYWDGTDTTANADGGAGTWDTIATNWDSAATAGSAVPWPSSGTDNDAVFAGTAGTVTIATGGVTANDLTFSMTNYTIGGAGLTLNGTLPVFSVTGTATINSSITSAVAGGFSKTGSGTLILGGANTFAASTTLAYGTSASASGGIRLANSSALSGITVINGVPASGASLEARIDLTGGITVTGTELRIGGRANAQTTGVGLVNVSSDNAWTGAVRIFSTGGGHAIRSDSGTLTISGAVNSNIGARTWEIGGVGNVTITGAVTTAVAITKFGAGVLTLSGSGNTYTGDTKSGAGSLVINHANALSGSALDMATADTGTVSFGPTITAATLGSLKGSRNLSLLNTAATPAAVTLTVGANNATNTYTGQFSGSGHLYKTGSGTETLDPGAVSISIGSLSANGGSLTLKSGTFTNTAKDPLASLSAYNVGAGARGGTLTIDGATLNVGSGNNLKIGAITSGNLSILSGTVTSNDMVIGHNAVGVATQSGGTVTVTNIYHQDGATGNSYTLSGGSLTAKRIFNTTTTAVDFTLNLNGGTLKSAASTTNLIDNQNTGNQITVLLGAGNTIIDTTTSSASIVRPMGDMPSVAGTFTKAGNNSLTLTGANTYSGGTTVNQGTLTVGTGGTLGATTGALAVNNTNTAAGTAAVLNLATAVDTTVGTLSGSIATPSSGTNSATINTQTARNFTVNQTAAGTYAGVIAGAGSVTLGSLSTNTLTFTGANTYSGGTIINQGTLTVGTGGALGATTGALAVNNTNTSAGTAAVLNLATAVDTTVGTLSGSIATPSSGTNTATINTQAAQNFTVNQTAAGTYAGVIAGAGSFTLGSLSTNTLTLSGPNTYSGNTVISNGTLATGVAAAIPFGAAKGNVILDGGGTSAGVLDLAGLNISINGLSGLTGVVLGKVVNNISASAAVLSVGNNDATSSFAGILANNSSGTGTLGLIKTGSGTLTLSGANTYTDATSVTAGTLALVGGSQTSPITVNSGAALGFTLGSPTTSTSTVTFSGATAKVTVTGTPAAATLMTASNITGTPVLDPAIPGYELAIESGGTQLNLKASAPAHPFNTWATTTNGLSGANAAAGADPDNDGINNAIEFVIGGQPNPANANSMSSALLPTSTLDSSNLIFTYRRTDLSMTEPGIGINVEYGSDLNGWHTAVNGTGGVAITVTNDGFDTGVDKVEVSIPRSLAVGFSLFARLNVVIP